jgi:hypothetical protein
MSNLNVFEDARAAIVTQFKTYWDANHSTVPVQYENRDLVDIEKQTAPYVCCEVIFNDGFAASIGDTPMARYPGAVWLSVHTKEGEGTKLGNQWLGALADLFKAKMLGGLVYTGIARPVPARLFKGWYVQAVRIPFRVHDI